MENIFEKLITPEMIMGYKSPIEVMVGEMVMQYENDILKAVQDVGINVDENGKLCGDVKWDGLEEAASAATPVPGGVGAVTTAVLCKHLAQAALRRRG